MDYDRLVRAYRNIRGARDELRKTYEAQDNELKAQLERLEGVMLGQLTTTNVMRMSTPSGTFFRSVDIIPRVDDWEALYGHIRSTDSFDLLERRIGRVAVKRYMDTHTEMPPPGVSVLREWKIGVRKPTDKVTNNGE